MRIIGLDFGSKTIGVSMSDPFGWTAQGIETICRDQEESIKPSLQRLEQIIKEYAVDTIVLGFPKNMNNTEGPRCEKTLEFKERLEKRFKLPVILCDERLSTVAAERSLLEADMSRSKRKKVIDKMAAVYILQGYLDRKDIKKYRGENMDKDKNFVDNEDMEEDYPIITMTDDETGEDIEFMVVDAVEVEDEKYFLVIESKDIDNDDAEAILLKEDPKSKGEDVIYSIVENDIEFESIIQLLCESNDDYDLKF